MLKFTLAAVLLVAPVRAGTNAEGLKFLEENKGKPGVITLPSGLQYKVLRTGDGAFHPTADASCECHCKSPRTRGRFIPFDPIAC